MLAPDFPQTLPVEDYALWDETKSNLERRIFGCANTLIADAYTDLLDARAGCRKAEAALIAAEAEYTAAINAEGYASDHAARAYDAIKALQIDAAWAPANLSALAEMCKLMATWHHDTMAELLQ